MDEKPDMTDTKDTPIVKMDYCHEKFRLSVRIAIKACYNEANFASSLIVRRLETGLRLPPRGECNYNKDFDQKSTGEPIHTVNL